MDQYVNKKINMCQNNKPLLSIITVTYNAENKIEKTINSVYRQTNTDYEYIFVDGFSEDKTIQIVERYKWEFAKKKVDYRYISEVDTGIYDAMNKGVSLAKGCWVCFLNAGDLFYDIHTLERIKAFIDNDSTGIIYGDTIEFKNNGLIRYEKALPIEQITYKMPFCHQSTIVKTELLRDLPFDQSYKICADYDFFATCFKNKVYFKYLNIPVSRYEFGGLSSLEKYEIILLQEQAEIQIKHGFISEEGYKDKLNEIEKFRRYKKLTGRIKRLIPNVLLEIRIYILDILRGWVKET